MTYKTHIRVFEAFAGYGSQAMALKRLSEDYPDFSYEVVGISEIDKHALLAYEAVHGHCPNFGDISKIDWEQVPDFDLFTYSFPCFRGDTLVYTINGYKRIDEIRPGDQVLTHTNRFQCVTSTIVKYMEGVRMEIKPMGSESIHCTEEHPFYIRKMLRQGHKRERVFLAPEWIKAKDLTDDCYLGYAINTENEIPSWEGVVLNNWGHHRRVNTISPQLECEPFWYLMGRYVGDGWKRSSRFSKGIVICCGGRNEEELINAMTEQGWRFSVSRERTVRKYHICSKELASFVDMFGYTAKGKRIPAAVLNLPTRLLRAFIDGVIHSDGCTNGKYIKISTVSRELICGLGQCVAKAYQRPFSIHYTKRPRITVIEGRQVSQADSYELVFKTSSDIQDKAFYEDGYIWMPMKVVRTYDDEYPVYNLSVGNDQSYTANGAIVHNCQDISNAGLQRGFAEGSGTRSGLLWECRKAIEAKRPKYLLMENVKALIQKKNMPDFNKWQLWLEEEGYSNFWKVLNAKDFGVAQNRERVFMVSILRTGENPRPSFSFPEGFPLEKRVEDYMEKAEDVAENYYISQERITEKVLSDILNQANVRAEMEKLYHEEQRKADSNQH